MTFGELLSSPAITQTKKNVCRHATSRLSWVRPYDAITPPTSNWRGRRNKKFCIFKQPFVGIDS